MNLTEISNDELNRRCAEKVMGWFIDEDGYWCSGNKEDESNEPFAEEYTFDWTPTTDHNQSMQVVDKMIKDGCYIEIHSNLVEGGWTVCIPDKSASAINWRWIEDKSLSRAIVIASLKAVEIKEAKND